MAQQQQDPYHFLQRLFLGQHRIVRNLQEQLKERSKQIHQLQQQLQQQRGHWQPQSWAWSDWSSAGWQQQQGHCQRQSWAWSNWSSAWWQWPQKAGSSSTLCDYYIGWEHIGWGRCWNAGGHEEQQQQQRGTAAADR